MRDVIVIGLGIYGAAIAAEAGHRGLSVLALDQYQKGHTKGSSHGTSRIFRFTTLESENYVLRANRAAEIWKSYDVLSSHRIISQSGFGIIEQPDARTRTAHGVDNVVSRAAEVAVKYSITHKLMTGGEFKERFPSLNCQPDDRVFFEPGAFLINANDALQAIITRAEQSGNVELLYNAIAISVRPERHSVRVTLADDELEAKSAIICTGPWGHQSLLNNIEPTPLRVYPQLTLNVPVHSAHANEFPAYVHVPSSGPIAYAVPGHASSELKFGIEQTKTVVPRPGRKALPSDFLATTAEEIRTSARTVIPTACLENARADLCYYAVTPGSKHIIRYLGDKHLVLVSACSGHGFKLAPAIAEEVVANLIVRS
jgi:sarcosine oxidase